MRRPNDRGYVILGANALARSLARVLLEGGYDAVCVDTNPDACAETERQGIPVVMGNGLRPETLERAEIETQDTKLRPGDELVVLVCKERAAAADASLRALGLAPKTEAARAEVA